MGLMPPCDEAGTGMSVRVVVVGSANMDLVATAPVLPAPGQTVLGRDFTTVAGGKGANQAVAAARAGARCAMIGAVGDDAFGAALRQGLRGAGVDASLVRTAPGPSGVALIAVGGDGENQIVVVPGANATLTELHGRDLAAIAGADLLMAQLEVPVATVTAAARAARDAGVTVLLNAAPARELPADLLSTVDILVVNEGEARTVAGRADGVLDALLELVPRVVLTLGARGAAYADRDGTRVSAPAPLVPTVDTTAAGDAFAGAFAVAWAEARPVTEALRWACAAGAACVRTLGAAGSLPARAQIDELYRAA
jgi:ribokinase